MTFAELVATTPVDRWRSLPAEAQERIGSKLLEHVFAELVADDDGSEATRAEQIEARFICDNAFSELFRVVEASFPQVAWWNEPCAVDEPPPDGPAFAPAAVKADQVPA